MKRTAIEILLTWFLPSLIAIFFLQIILGSGATYFYSISETRDYLQHQIDRVKEDLNYKNGKWDTSQYNADSIVPSVNPLYIITSDGFVIDRWKPIHGLLDASEFTRLLTYTTPQTINTITNENWRVLSQPINNGNEIVGVILVTAYKPDQNNLPQIDEQLTQTINDIQSIISTQGQALNVSKLDPRKLPFNITYQIVNKFNRIVALSDNVNSITRTPTFIDASYIDSQLKASAQEQVIDSETKNRYLVERSPIYDGSKVIGIVVAGAPIDSIFSQFAAHLVLFGAIDLGILLLSTPLFVYLLTKTIRRGVKQSLSKKDVAKIIFLKKESKLVVDAQAIDIPYASYQYYFCDTLFSKPQKRWEIDEIIEKFGESNGKDSWRKVYDTMVALNKKLSVYLAEKLFIVKDKTYRINPIFTDKIAS